MLPDYTGDGVTLLVRDPWWVFAYWSFEKSGLGGTVLRVYDVTDQPEPGAVYFDVDIEPVSGRRYVDVGKPDREWIAEIGVRSDQGFQPLARSNRVHTPRALPSANQSSSWMENPAIEKSRHE